MSWSKTCFERGDYPFQCCIKKQVSQKIFVTSNPFFFSERKGEETEVTNDFFLINQIIVGTLMEYQPFDFSLPARVFFLFAVALFLFVIIV
jgi:hypothetical protein